MIEYGDNLGAFVLFSSFSCMLTYMTIVLILMEKWNRQFINNSFILITNIFWVIFETWVLSTMSNYWDLSLNVWELKRNVLDSNGFRRMSLVGRLLLWINFFFLVRRVVDRWQVKLFQINTPPHVQPIPLNDLEEGTIGRPIDDDTPGGNLHKLIQQQQEEEEDEEDTTEYLLINNSDTVEEEEESIVTSGISNSEFYFTEQHLPRHNLNQISPRIQWAILTIINLMMLILVLFDIALHGYLHFTSTIKSDNINNNLNMNKINKNWAQIANLITTAILYLIISIILIIYIIFLGSPRKLSLSKFWPFFKQNWVLICIFTSCYLIGMGANIFNLSVLYEEHRWLILLYISFELLVIVLGYQIVQAVELENYQAETNTIIGRTLFQIH